jgi:hypothetical protein
LEKSKAIRYLKAVYGAVTKAMLLNLVFDVLAICPVAIRPLPPSRNQKRAKGGLVAWLDEHQSLVLSYLKGCER